MEGPRASSSAIRRRPLGLSLTFLTLLAFTLTLSGCMEALAQTDTQSRSVGPGDNVDTSFQDAKPVVMTGTLLVLFADEIDSRRSERQFFLEDKQSKKRWRLQFNNAPPGHLRSGVEITIRGNEKGGQIFLAADGVDGSPTGSSAPSSGKVSGEQRTLVLVGDFADNPITCSVGEVQDLMFSSSSGQSVADYYQDSSHGSIRLSGQAAGPYLIPSPDSCSVPFTSYTDPLDAAALADGIDVSTYDRQIYVLPYTGCGYAGAGSVGNTPSQALVFTCGIPDVYAHELGHNFGMYHASTSNSEYGDETGIMGASHIGLRQLNSAHVNEMGWRSAAMNTLVTESGTYDLAPQSLAESQALAPQILRIPKSDTNEYYFVAFRRPVGFDANLPWYYHEQITVHRYHGGENAPTNTYLVKRLNAGESFVDNSNSVTITYMAGTPDYATVGVALDSETVCSPGNPGVSVAPGSQSGAAGSTLSFVVSVTNTDSPECAPGSFELSGQVPAGWNASLNTDTLTLMPGESGSATWNVTSPVTAAPDSHALQLQVTHGADSTLGASAAAVYLIESAACQAAPPALSVSPANQVGDAGATRDYVVTLLNQDASACATGSFELAATLPAGWNSTVLPATLALAPGASGTATVAVTSPSEANDGTYSVNVTAAEAGIAEHSASTQASYTVERPAASAADTSAPSVPGGLAASANHRHVSLSWTASTDNVAVAGYYIYRDGAHIGTSDSASYNDRSSADGATYAYSVAAYDAAGNVSAMSDSVSAGKSARGGGGGKCGKGKKQC